MQWVATRLIRRRGNGGRSLPAIIFAAISLWLAAPLVTAAERVVSVGDDVDISVRTWAGGGPDLLLWLPSEYGIRPRHQEFAAALSGRGVSVWLPDLHSAWFLSPGPRSLDAVPLDALGILLQDAVERHRRVFVMAASRTVPLALRMLRERQLAGLDMQRVGGAVLLHPKLYQSTPQGGEEARVLPIARATNVPLFLVQPQLAAGHWRLPVLIETLEQGGAPVVSQSVPGVSDGFLTRMDATPAELAATPRFVDALPGALRLLASYGPVPAGATPLPAPAPAGATGKRDELLEPVAGMPPAPPLSLPDLNGLDRRLQELRGSVVLVNFWATWCPPCVEEIPSLERLYQRLEPRGFQVLAVDVGESPQQVREFLADKAVTFPVLLDPDGQMFKTWKIYAFPTSLVVDQQGRIRYAVYGAFQWDAEEVVTTLLGLLAEE